MQSNVARSICRTLTTPDHLCFWHQLVFEKFVDYGTEQRALYFPSSLRSIVPRPETLTTPDLDNWNPSVHVLLGADG